MPSMRNKIIILVSTIYLVGCGDMLKSDKQEITVEMLGVFKTPDNASGNASPRFYKLTFKSMTLSGEEEVEIENSDDTALKIIDRPQIIYREDFADYEEVEFTRAELTFEPEIVAGAKYKDNYRLEMTSPTLTVSEAFSASKGQGLRFLIRVLWKDTVNRDEDAETEELEAPQFEIEVDSY